MTAATVGGLVRYHGSLTEAHGRYRVAGTCTCVDCDNDRDVWDILARNHQANPRMFPAPGPEPVRYVLAPAGPDDVRNRLEHVRPESFTTTTTTTHLRSPAAMTTTAQAVELHLPLSTEYLTPDVTRYLLDNADLFRVVETCDGLMVYVPETTPADLPAALAAIVTRARELGCWWLDFDHAAPVYSDLPAPALVAA